MNIYDDFEAEVRPLLPGQRIRLVLAAYSPCPDMGFGLADDGVGAALPDHTPPLLLPFEPPPLDPEEDVPDRLPAMGVWRHWGAGMPMRWQRADGLDPSPIDDLVERLPIWRSQAHAHVVRVLDELVHELLTGDLQVDVEPADPSASQTLWTFLVSSSRVAAVRLRGGWVLAARSGHAGLYREVSVPELIEIPEPPLADWAGDVHLDEDLAAEAVDGADLAGLVARHGQAVGVDPVRAMLAGDEPPSIRRVREWGRGLDIESISEIETRVADEVEQALAIVDVDSAALEVLELRDRVESRLWVLALLERDDEARAIARVLDEAAVARGLQSMFVTDVPERLRQAKLEARSNWWGRA